MTNTYAVFNQHGQLEYVPTKANAPARAIELYVSILSERWNHTQHWEDSEKAGYTCKPVTIVDPAKLAALLEACERAIIGATKECPFPIGRLQEALANFRSPAPAGQGVEGE